ncbi:MAG: hypothetical protein KGI54_07145 [Pseudomonadota bacterium]|nr:hypothetical protein [Pseudomonadota bacterium]
MLAYFKTYEFFIIVIALLLSVIGIWGFGKWEFHEGVQSQIIKYKTTALVTQAKGEAVTTKVVTRYLTHIQVIHDAGTTIIKKVPIYVTHKDTSRCVVNNGFVQLWNGANKMQLPPSTSSVNEEASPVVLTDIAAQHAIESNLYWQQYEQLKALQDWVTQEQKAYK